MVTAVSVLSGQQQRVCRGTLPGCGESAPGGAAPPHAGRGLRVRVVVLGGRDERRRHHDGRLQALHGLHG